MNTPSKLRELLLFLVLFSYASKAAAQASGTFTPTGNMITPRIYHTATLLLNGKVLITGEQIQHVQVLAPWLAQNSSTRTLVRSLQPAT